METAENLVLQWKIIALCSLSLCLLLAFLLAITFKVRFDAGRASGAKDFYLDLANSYNEYHQKLGLYSRFQKFVKTAIKNEVFQDYVLKVSKKLTLN